MTNSDGSLFSSGSSYVTEDTTISLTMYSLVISWLHEFNTRYTEVASSIATDDDILIQNVDNLINQQKAVIEEGNRHLNEMDDFIHAIVEEPLRRHHTDREKACQGRHWQHRANNGEQSSIYYLDANNLYGGAMHRMMPYELVGVPERQEVMEKINRDPNGWVDAITQDIWQVWVLHRVRYRGTSRTPW